MKKNLNKILMIVLIILLNIGLDQVTKYYAKKHLPGKGTIHVVGDYMVLRYAENDGAFLSMGSNLPEGFKTVLLSILPTLVLAGFLIFVFLDKKMSKFEVIWVSTILVGGISNLLDRFRFDGFVTDFLNFGIGNLRTGILNIADMSITFGVIFLLVTPYILNKNSKSGLPEETEAIAKDGED